jgi:hypothetical protein
MISEFKKLHFIMEDREKSFRGVGKVEVPKMFKVEKFGHFYN